MYIPKHFEIQDQNVIDDFIQKNSFAIIISQTNNYPFATHVPLFYDEKSQILYGHFAKSNPHLDYLTHNSKVLVIFSGEHTYISPTWTQHKGVPTWNFTAVHAHGNFNLIDDIEKTKEVLSKLTQKYESTNGWNTDFSQKEQLNLLNHIVSFEIEIDYFEAKFKLSQNKSIEDQKSIIQGLEQNPNNVNREIAKLMRENLT